jgi:autotransporter-associated beta strand protein
VRRAGALGAERLHAAGIARRRLVRAGRSGVRTALLGFAVLITAALPAAAQDATWTGTGSEWTTGGNWSPASVPSGTATFTNNGAPVSVTISNNTSIDEILFTAAAPAYSFTVENGTFFNVIATGIVNNSPFAPSLTNNGMIQFLINATAGNATITNNVGGYISFGATGPGTSTAGSAAITNNGDIYFFQRSTAGGATITNNNFLQFLGTSTAGSATITNNSGGQISFFQQGTAGSAAITNNGLIQFQGISRAGSATITNNNMIQFIGNSTAGSATITNNLVGVVDFSASAGLNNDNTLSAGSIAGAGNYYLGADQLTVGGNNLSTTVSGVISDCGAGGIACLNSGATGGALVKVGSGTLTLSGADSYTGATMVNAGTLEVDGSIADTSSVTVNSGGTLSGTGTVGPTTIMSGGALTPGNAANPTGTLTIAGNLVFQSAAMYIATISGSASNTNVTGTASLAGTVQVAFASGATSKSYDILHSGGLGGTMFSGAISDDPNYAVSLSYTATDVLLNLAASLGNGGGLNRNQQNVANAINNDFNSGGALPPNIANLFNLTGSNLANTLTQLDGEVGTGAQTSAFQLMNQFLNLLFVPSSGGGGGGRGGGGAIGFAPEQTGLPPDIALAYASVLNAPPPATFDQRWTTWGSAFGGSNTTDGNATIGSNNVTAHDYGFAGGMDYHLDPGTVLGFALAGGGTNWNLAQGLGNGRSDAFQAGIYGKRYFGPAYVSGALAFTNNWFTTTRTVLGDQLTASFSGQSYAARLEAGYRYGLPAPAASVTAGITPYAALQAQWFHTPSYSETDLTSGGFGLSYNATTATDTRSELGARFDDLLIIDHMPLILRARAAWAHDWLSDSSLTAVFQALPGASFIVNGATPPKDSALATAEAELRLTANWSLLAKFDGEFADGSQTYAGTATARYTW